MDACFVGLSEGRLYEALADTLTLGRRCHADNGQIPRRLGNCSRRTWPHEIDDASVGVPTSDTERRSKKLIFCLGLCVVYRYLCRQQPHCCTDRRIRPYDEAALPSALAH